MNKRKCSKQQRDTNQIIDTRAVVFRNGLQNSPGLQVTHTQTGLHIQTQTGVLFLVSGYNWMDKMRNKQHAEHLYSIGTFD